MKLTPDQMRELRLNQPQLTSEQVVQQARRNWQDLIERGLAPSNTNGSGNGPESSESSPKSATAEETISIGCGDLPEA